MNSEKFRIEQNECCVYDLNQTFSAKGKQDAFRIDLIMEFYDTSNKQTLNLQKFNFNAPFATFTKEMVSDNNMN